MESFHCYHKDFWSNDFLGHFLTNFLLVIGVVNIMLKFFTVMLMLTMLDYPNQI